MIKNATNHGPTAPAVYNAEEYPRGDKRLTMRAHILAELMRNAQRWVKGYQSPESAAKAYGSLYDCLLLAPDEFEARFCVPPETYTNKKGLESAWRRDMRIAEVAAFYEENEGKEEADQKVMALVDGAIKRLRENKLLEDLIDSSQHQVMVRAEWHDPVTSLVIPLKCLIDIVPPADHPIFGEYLVDLKSTRNAAQRPFASDAQKFRYDIQAGLYCDMWQAATGENRINFAHCIQENYPPFEYRSRPPILSQRFLDWGKLSYKAALTRYCQCLESGVWPSYDRESDSWPITDCADWFLDAATIYNPITEPDEPEEDEEVEAEPVGITP